MTEPAIQRTLRRRRLRQWAVRAAAVILLAVSIWASVVEPSRLVQRDHALMLPHWPQSCDGLRIDVVGDTHTGSPHNGTANLDRVVQALMASDASVVLLAGDYVILQVLLGGYVPGEQIVRHLQPLAARKPVYAVLGNHDWWKGGPAISRAFSGAGIHMIDNRAVPVQVGQCRFWLAGLGDLLEGDPDVPGTYARIPHGQAVIALTHEPDLFPAIPSFTALTIAGHTHGGQIDPFPRGVQPGRFVSGSHWLNGWLTDGERHLFVTPGVGTSILPLRLGVPPEISRLTLHAVSRSAPPSEHD